MFRENIISRLVDGCKKSGAEARDNDLQCLILRAAQANRQTRSRYRSRVRM